jgi:hypothetical protein
MMKFTAWLGTVTSIAGSFSVAFQSYTFGYMLFMLGSISWLTVAAYRKDFALGVLNGTFLVANIIGLYNALA